MKLRANAKGSFRQTLIFILSLAVCLGLSRVSSALDEAKIHVAGTPNITSFVYHVGKEKGFYREEGIETIERAGVANEILVWITLLGMMGSLKPSFTEYVYEKGWSTAATLATWHPEKR